jgi:maltooligosyltrehalose trehalohydrolase
MTSADLGWWAAEGSDLAHGTDYAFVVDDAEPALPDPRSPWQPAGVHGPSRVVDHGRFEWTDQGWQAPPLASAVIYELHIGTFTPAGTFDGAIASLDALRELGVTHVEVMPVAAFPGRRGWGYDGVALYAPHDAYGGPDGLKRFVDACHARGLAVLLDVVYNHLGPSGNYLARFGPYFTSRYATPWGEAVNLDGPDSDEVRRFFLENACHWLRDYHVDGLRVDAVHAIIDTSARHFLEALAETVESLAASLGRHLVLIAESDLNDPRVVRRREVGGYGFDAQWNEDFHHALHAVLTGEDQGYYADFGRLADVAKALRRGLVYDGVYSPYRRRRHGRPAADLPGHRFIGCLQNHDQVGNRAQGDRTSHLLSPGRQRIGAALVLTAPFVPTLFQGEEWAASTPFQYFTDHDDAVLGRAVSEGRRREFAAFGWRPGDVPDPQSPDTFARSVLDWDERGREPHAGILAWHRQLIDLRRRLPALTSGDLSPVEVRIDERDRWLAMTRGSVTVACNLAPERRQVPLPESATDGLLTSDPEARPDRGAIALAPDTVVILGSRDERAALSRRTA